MIFGRHSREFARAIRAGAWERTPEGVWFPRQGALLSGEVRWGDRRQHNLVCDGGLRYLGGLLDRNVLSPTYVVPFGFDVVPTPEWDVLDLYLAGELGDAPEGYDEAVRQDWTIANEGSRVIGNTAAAAVFTIRTATSLDVYGFAIVTDTSTKFSGGPIGTFDPTPIDTDPAITTLVTTRGTIRTATDTMAVNYCWLDPSGDDFYDSGAGHWVDPGLDDLDMAGWFDRVNGLRDPFAADGRGVFGAIRFSDAPEPYVDMDSLPIIWTVQLR